MATKDISKYQVLIAVGVHNSEKLSDRSIVNFLIKQTGQPCKVCIRALEREVNEESIDYGVSINQAFLTKKGVKELAKWANINVDNPSLWLCTNFGVATKSTMDGKILIDREVV
ncbi:hypothetical protein ERJ77_01875 [Vibrio anguillarum]|uniref:Uncharacterized protein n=1 Tax=Vibrio anguillarum TaxID=55601 RepID=A0AAW4BA94_VIBAN|nr:hypothetical protein [Vibrio anguillarum]